MACKYCICKLKGGLADGKLDALKASVSSFLDKYDNVMGAISQASKVAVDYQMAIEDGINNCLEYFVAKPLYAMGQLNSILKLPSQTAANISSKLYGYASLLEAIVDTNCDTYCKKLLYQTITNSIMAYSLTSATFSEFESRQEAALSIALLKQIKETRELFAESIEGTVVETTEDTMNVGQEYVSNADSNLALENAYVEVMQYIENSVMTLPIQRTIELSSDRNYIELCMEIHGSIDEDVLEEFISDNNIEGEELFILRKGREIVYYKEAT